MVCYLCQDYTFEPLINCRNKLCKSYFHKSCWKKYLKINNLKNDICKVCYDGTIEIKNKNINNFGEVYQCDCISCIKIFFNVS